MFTKLNGFLESIFVGVASMCTFMFGSFDTPLQILLILIVADYVTGLMKGYVTKSLSSSVGATGLIKKASIFIVLIIGVLADRLLGTEFVIKTIVGYFYIFNESISILENLGTIGVPIPKKLIEALTKVKDVGGDTYKKDETDIKE